MEEKSIFLKVELDTKDLLKTAEDSSKKLTELKDRQKELKDSGQQNSVEYAKLKEEIKQYTKSLNDSASALVINEKLQGKSNLTGIEQAQLQKSLAVAYNNLTDEQKKNTVSGQNIAKAYAEVNDALNQSSLSVNDGRRNVGLYEQSIKKAIKEIESLTKEQQQVSTAIGFTTKKSEDAKKRLDQLGDSADKTSAEYIGLQNELKEYNETLESQKAVQHQVNKELEIQQVQLQETTKAAEKIGFVYGVTEEKSDSLKKQLRDVKQELAEIAEQKGIDSKEFIEATQRAGELQDRLKDVNEAVSASATGSKFEQLSNQAGLLGSDLANLDFEGVAEKAAAFQQTASSITFKEISAGAGNAGKALLSLGKTLITSPLFLILGSVGLIVAFWSDISEAIGLTNKAQEEINATTEDYKKGASSAAMKTNEVAAAFQMAKKGVISKEEALKTYNDTLGDSFGKAKNLNEAEENYIKKTSAYIEAAGLRAQANALFTKAADEQATALTAQFEDQTNVLEKAWIIIKNGGTLNKQAIKELAAEQAKAVKEERARAADRAKAISDEAQKLMEQAEVVENKNGIISESEKQLNAEMERLANERYQKAKELQERAIEDAKNARLKIRDLMIEQDQLDANAQLEALNAELEFTKKAIELTVQNELEKNRQLLEVDEDYLKEYISILDEKIEAEKSALEASAEDEINSLKGTKQQIAEQKQLIEENLAIQIDQIDKQAKDDLSKREQELAEKRIQINQNLNSKLLKLNEEKISNFQNDLDEQILLLEQNGKTELEILQATYKKQVELAEARNKAIQEDETKTDQEKKAAQTELNRTIYELNKNAVEQEKELNAEKLENAKAITNQIADTASQLISSFNQIREQQTEQLLQSLQANFQSQNESLEAQLNSQVISLEKYNQEKEKLEKAYQSKERAIKLEQFERTKRANLIEAGINTAVAVTEALPNLLLAGIAGALGALQIGFIAGQTPGFADGGLTGQLIGQNNGISISRPNGDNLLATVKTGEIITNKSQQRYIESVAGSDIWARAGVKGFAGGGMTGVNSVSSSGVTRNVNSYYQQKALIQDIVGNMPNPIVDVVQILDKSTEYTTTIVDANI